MRTIFPDTNFYYGIAGNTGNPLAGLGGGPGSGAIDSQLTLSNGANQNRPTDHIPVAPGSYQNAVIILLTDGATTAGPDPIAAGQIAADWGVKVFTVGFGSPNGAVVDFAGRSMRAQLDETTLKAIAQKTDGEYFAAQSADDLTKVYSALSAKLVGETKKTEIAFIFAGIGALLAMVAGGLSLWWFGKLA
jgi:Ca-activated chloride channel family protein